MATIKKNQLANIIFPMVDKTDFASLESGITASDFNSAATKKFYGVTHGNSTAYTSGTISKATTLVRSGIFQQTLKTSETNYDYLMIRFVHPSCADQLLVFHAVDYDDSDIFSQLSDIGSNLLSYLTGMSGMLSDVDSQLLLNASMISDIQSALDSQFVWTSNFLSDMNSDLSSQIGGITATVSASDMSDIASRVWATTEGTRVDSRILVIQSMVSDVDSQLLLNASVISDIQSALDSQFVYMSAAVSDVDSQLLLNASAISDIESQLDVTHSLVSDVESQLDAVWTTQLTEAYNADGTAPTAAQALFMIMQTLNEFSISGTTLTVKKLDGSTTAATFTLDDGTNPTSLTRAT